MPAFKPFRDAKHAVIEQRDTLQLIAERARAEGNDITDEDISLFNWGTREPEHIQELMRDALGARERMSPMEFVLSPEDQPREPLRVPEIYRQGGFATTRTHTLRIRYKRCTDQFIGCSSLPALTFPFDSSFVRPSVAESLGAVEALIAKEPDSRLIVFGHTDAVGDDSYNKRLSERRAWSVYSFILNDADAWETLYNHPDEDWGVAAIQEILTDLGFDPGGIDGDLGPATQAQMRAFLGLPDGAPVQNDASFRKQLFAAYMGGKHEIKIGKGRFLDPGHMGCGEFNLLEAGEAANPRNRRVTIYAFHKERPPVLPCAYDDVLPCKKQMVDTDQRHQIGFSCSFYDSLAGHCPGEGLRCLRVYLLDFDGHAIPHCPFRARDRARVIVEGTADGDGLATLPDSVPNVIDIDWDRPKGADAAAGGFRFSRCYIVSVSAPQTRSGCAVRLENLGFDAEDFEDRRAAFAAAFGAHAATPLADFAKDIDQWHRTGDPSHIAPQESEPEEALEVEEPSVDLDPWYDAAEGGEEHDFESLYVDDDDDSGV